MIRLGTKNECEDGSKNYILTDKLAIFVLFTVQLQIEKAQMLCLGFEPGTEGWQALTDQFSYGGKPPPPSKQMR